MYKDATYKDKFAALQDWIPVIVETIKKEIKNDHLRKDLFFFKKYFGSSNVQKIPTEELAKAYEAAIQNEEKGEEIAEFIVSRWLFKHAELYEFFEKHLMSIHPDFTSLDEIPQEQAKNLIDKSTSQHGAVPTYLFSVLNSVVFPAASFQQLEALAKKSHQDKIEEEQATEETKNIESIRAAHQRDILRLTDKYEKKLAGMQKKYLSDVELLKKQVANLQRKLQEKS